MNGILEILAIFCGTTLFFGSFLGFFAYLRYLRYKEILALADKGVLHPSYQRNGRATLWWGLVITGLGIALSIGLYPIGWVAFPGEFPLNFGPWMIAGLIPLFFGLSLIAVYVLTREKNGEEPAAPFLSTESMVEEDLFPVDEAFVSDEIGEEDTEK